MSKPYRVHTTSSFRMKTKDVKKKDIVNVAGCGMTVLSNKKNSFGERVITCTDFRTKSLNTLILPKDLKVTVTRHKTKHAPQSR